MIFIDEILLMLESLDVLDLFCVFITAESRVMIWPVNLI